MDFYMLKAMVDNFAIDGNVMTIKEHGSGNINRTFLVETDAGKNYILQRINAKVFTKPYVLMRNIDSVTNFCRDSIRKNGGNPERETLTIIKTKDGKNLLRVDDDYYRMYIFVTDCMVFDKLSDAEMFASAGKAFGRFAKLLDGYEIEELDETIPDFHNSKVRYKNFLKDIKRDCCGRVSGIEAEIEEIKSRFLSLTRIVDYMEVGEIPTRVTHNDTKISNVLFDKETGDAMCVIDLDTVMPGSILFDFGDAIRSGAAKAPEDAVGNGIRMDYYKKFARAYLEETYDILTEKEAENLAFACITITLELAMRFLDDYINGDTYFRCEYEDHNLARARNQLELVRSMEDNFVEMASTIDEILVELKSK